MKYHLIFISFFMIFANLNASNNVKKETFDLSRQMLTNEFKTLRQKPTNTLTINEKTRLEQLEEHTQFFSIFDTLTEENKKRVYAQDPNIMQQITKSINQRKIANFKKRIILTAAALTITAGTIYAVTRLFKRNTN